MYNLKPKLKFSVSAGILFTVLAACTGPQIAQNPDWTPAVIIITPTAEPVQVEPTPTPLNIPTTTYTIKQGENLSQIASRYGLTVDQLAALNGIDNPNTIQAGQEIKVPKEPVNGAPAPSPTSGQ